MKGIRSNKNTVAGHIEKLVYEGLGHVSIGYYRELHLIGSDWTVKLEWVDQNAAYIWSKACVSIYKPRARKATLMLEIWINDTRAIDDTVFELIGWTVDDVYFETHRDLKESDKISKSWREYDEQMARDKAKEEAWREEYRRKIMAEEAAS